MIDADSELFTAINVYAAGQDGAMIRDLESPDCGSIKVYMPPRPLLRLRTCERPADPWSDCRKFEADAAPNRGQLRNLG